MASFFLLSKYILFIARIFAQNYRMKYVVTGNDEIFNKLMNNLPDINWVYIENISGFFSHSDADAFFDLNENSNTDFSSLVKPVFVNSMDKTLLEMNAGKNIIRINLWPGFAEKELWEIAGEISVETALVLKSLHKKYITVHDEPGFISPRIIAMIINEAYFAKDENVSSENDIDIAMKLGTNYPYGPFEWCRLIGVKKVYSLLQKLAETDVRFLPAVGLKNEINHN
jgi:3-hydroxybutyryl-CoA dehydrogenase